MPAVEFSSLGVTTLRALPETAATALGEDRLVVFVPGPGLTTDHLTAVLNSAGFDTLEVHASWDPGEAILRARRDALVVIAAASESIPAPFNTAVTVVMAALPAQTFAHMDAMYGGSS